MKHLKYLLANIVWKYLDSMIRDKNWEYVTNHKKSGRGSLIKEVVEHLHFESFEFLEEAINDTMKGKPGIYALYDNKKLYYVGLSINLKERVEEHTKDRHVKKWNKFSIYIIKKTKFLKDVETILLRVIDPKGNKVKGKIPKLKSLQKVLINETKKAELEAKRMRQEARAAEKEARAAEKEAKDLRTALKSTRKEDSRKKVAKTRRKKW